MILTKEEPPKSVENAKQLMAKAEKGEIEAREPLTGIQMENGKIRIIDGNATVSALQGQNVLVPVRVLKPRPFVNKIVVEPTTTNLNVRRQRDIVNSLAPQETNRYLDFKKRAHDDFQEFQLKFDQIKKKFGLETWDANQKSDARAVEKAFDDYNETGVMDFERIKDMNRGNYITDNFQDYKDIVNAIKTNFEFVEGKNRLENPTSDGYRDLLLNVKMPNGTYAEIQILPKKMSELKTKLHPLYEKTRVLAKLIDRGEATLEERIEFQKLREQQRKQYGAGWKQYENDFKAVRKELFDILKPQKVFGFVSPSTKVGLQYKEADQALKSPEHQQSKKKLLSIMDDQGIKKRGNVRSAIGRWIDGAENTFYIIGEKISKNDLIVALARAAKDLRQKQFIWFKESPVGKDELFVLNFKKGQSRTVSEALVKNGIEFQTINTDKILVFNKFGEDFDSTMESKMLKTVEELKLDRQKLGVYNGIGEFEGSFLEGEQARVEAQKKYDDLIQRYDTRTQKALREAGFDRPRRGEFQLRDISEPRAKPEKEVGAGGRERGFIRSVRRAIPRVEIAGQYTPRDTDELAIKARNLVKDNVEVAEREAHREVLDDVGVAITSELLKHYGETKQYGKAADLAGEAAAKLTELGRSVQAASILGRLTPEGMLRFAASEIQKYNEKVSTSRGGLFGLRKKVPELTAEQAKDISTKMKQIQEMKDGPEKAIAFHKLQTEISQLVPSPWYKKVINLWKAGLLTGLKTTDLNTLSNLFHGVSEVVKDIPAVAVDKGASLFTGKQTMALTVRGVTTGVKEGFNKGVRYLKTGFDERNIAAKLDYRQVNYGQSKFARGLQKYEETIFHLLGAEDQPFYYGAKSRSLYSQAIAQAKNKGLKGKEAKKFVEDLVQNPTDEMLTNAVNDAEIAVFQNRTLLGSVARTIQKVPGGEVVVPFGRTPAAVATQLINYSPVGIVKTIITNIGKGRFNQRTFAQGIGRGVTGTAAMAIGMALLRYGMLSLNYPEEERERKQWELEGRKENAFKTPDGKWRSVAVLGPLGLTLVLGGYYQRAMDKSGSHSEALAEAAFGAAKSLTEQTFLQGLNQFMSALTDPEGFGLAFITRLIASAVPTLVNDIARTTDPFERRTKAKQEGFFASLISRIPKVRETLEPKIDVFGRPIEIAGNAIETMIDPTRPTKIKSSVVIEELRRLAEADFHATPTGFADEKSYTVLTPEQRTRLQERAGQMLESKLENLFASSNYQELSDDERQKKIQDFTNKARLIARAEMVEEVIQGLNTEEQKAKLSELKKAKFLTKGVFDKWQELFR